jgi:hypothetical protein
VAALPGALTSVVPELMVDYLATVFVEQDAQPVARYAGAARGCMLMQRAGIGTTHRWTCVARRHETACREPAGEGTGAWSLLRGYLSDDPDSAPVVEDLEGMAKAADLARAAIADIQRLEIASTRNLGYLDPRRYR